jgi:hypothetical protein
MFQAKDAKGNGVKHEKKMDLCLEHGCFLVIFGQVSQVTQTALSSLDRIHHGLQKSPRNGPFQAFPIGV